MMHLFSMYRDETQMDVEHQWYLDYFRVYQKPQQSAPAPAQLRFPRDGSQRVSVHPWLKWQKGDRAGRHRIHFGTESNPPFVKEQAAKEWTPGEVQPNTTYYWRIDEINTADTTPGTIWRFNTGPGYVIESEDMRSLGYGLPDSLAYLELAADTGIAVGWFPGPDGTYDISVRYFDAANGQAGMLLLLDSVSVKSWTADSDDNAWHLATVEGVVVLHDAIIDVRSRRSGPDAARLDRIEFNPPGTTVEYTTAVTPTRRGLPGGRAVYSICGERLTTQRASATGEVLRRDANGVSRRTFRIPKR